jgi:hypothetical protein
VFFVASLVVALFVVASLVVALFGVASFLHLSL